MLFVNNKSHQVSKTSTSWRQHPVVVWGLGAGILTEMMMMTTTMMTIFDPYLAATPPPRMPVPNEGLVPVTVTGNGVDHGRSNPYQQPKLWKHFGLPQALKRDYVYSIVPLISSQFLWDLSHSHIPPKFNINLKKWWLEDYFPFGMVYFQGRTVKLPRDNLWLCNTSATSTLRPASPFSPSSEACCCSWPP